MEHTFRTLVFIVVFVSAAFLLQCKEDTENDTQDGDTSDTDSNTDTDSETEEIDITKMLPSEGCNTKVVLPESGVQQTIEIDGETRYYLIDVPEEIDNETPLMLVFALHGYDMNNVAVVDLFNFTSRSKGKAITVYPQGEGPPPGDESHWGDHVLESTWEPNKANFAFIETLTADLEERFCIDKNRKYMAGFSMGGFFTNAVACEHPEWFRGYAPTSGGGPEDCENEGATPAVIIQHGTEDHVVDASSSEATRDFWLEQNECGEDTDSIYSGCTTYDCPENKPVVFCLGDWNHYISSISAANIWSFFKELKTEE